MSPSERSPRADVEQRFDLAIAGAGPAGLLAAIFAARRGARVFLADQAPQIGGTLPMSRGQISGAGTRLQRERGIADSADAHLQDILRLSGGTADRRFAAFATSLQGPFIDWLIESGFEMAEGMPKIIHGQEAYSTARTYWGREEGRSLVKFIEPLLGEQIDGQRIVLRLATRVVDLVLEDGAVVGLKLDGGQIVRATQTLLATGGYGGNPELFAKLHAGRTISSGASHYADGSGLEMGLRAGGVLAHAETAATGFGGILDHTVDPPRYRSFGGLTPQDRPQWEIVVNRAGERFYAEDSRSVEARARALAQQPGSRAWVIYDETIRHAAPPLFHYFSAVKAADFYRNSAFVRSATTLKELAARSGIDPAGLTRTVEMYNRACSGAVPDPLGRSFLPRAIAQPPFWSVEIASYAVRSFGGLRCDARFRVLDGDGDPIPGLYAAGEILGNFIVGHGSAGGMALTPALVFGRWIGEQVAIERSDCGPQPPAADEIKSAVS